MSQLTHNIANENFEDDDKRIISSLEYLLREARSSGQVFISRAIEVAISIISNHGPLEQKFASDKEDLITAAVFLIKSVNLSYYDKSVLFDAIAEIEDSEDVRSN